MAEYIDKRTERQRREDAIALARVWGECGGVYSDEVCLQLQQDFIEERIDIDEFVERSISYLNPDFAVSKIQAG